MILHETFCVKFVKKCEICDEAVNIEDMDDHVAENHKKIDCNDCGKVFDKKHLSSHKKKCDSKPVKCSFCELELDKDDLHDHEYMCGSKTEECPTCLQLVPIRGSDYFI
jgi:hypothetical protein